MARIDFRVVRNFLFPYSVLDLLGREYSLLPSGSMRTSCPLYCCRTRQAPRIVAMSYDGLWFCHKCKQSGDIIDYFAKATDTALYAAAKELCERFNIPIPYLNAKEQCCVRRNGRKRNGEEAR